MTEHYVMFSVEADTFNKYNKKNAKEKLHSKERQWLPKLMLPSGCLTLIPLYDLIMKLQAFIQVILSHLSFFNFHCIVTAKAAM